MSRPAATVLLTSLLKEVSRSFYLTMRILPAAVRPQISLAYLLARTTDTIADTEMVAVESRLQALAALRGRILGASVGKLEFGELAQNQGLAAERVLLKRVEESLDLLAGCADEDRQRIREVLEIIISGQELDLQRFAGGTGERIVALETEAELEDYTYRVAGCVGEFWTKICRAHLFPSSSAADERFLLRNGVAFGKGLQLVNILRDVPKDLRNGRCYLPRQELAAAGLAPGPYLLNPVNETRFRPIYDRYLEKAQEHLGAGWDYTNYLPKSEKRVKLACAWPILIGVKTLKKLRKNGVLDPVGRIKVARREVYGVILRTVLYYPFPRAWKGLFWGSVK